MKKRPYTILRQGTDEDGGAWADYINADGEKCQIQVRAGLDLKGRLRRREQADREYREEIAAMSPEELAENKRIGERMGRRWGNHW